MNDIDVTAATATDTTESDLRQPVIKIHWEGLFTREGLVITTPGTTMPSELVEWIKSWVEVKKLAIADGDVLGQTDYVGLAWEDSIDVDMFTSTIIEMVCHFFGWDRAQVRFAGSWNEEENEIAFARQALQGNVPPLRERVLVLRSGLDYTINGTVEVTVVDGKTVLRVV
jgi:hypothetical protein